MITQTMQVKRVKKVKKILKNANSQTLARSEALILLIQQILAIILILV